ncbi:hypothetical protein [Microbulbifer sp. 2205BS26-8]|uniref:hypothetical protein n=1 Tax=Microbulbifer sp. 2205BS26-8 TaxID=3064386 RepID=UPI00273D2259|nr:hypothetical protein [Microbulbifer sp. 2205BS26-8]MDP5209844.1 hypothetical protein [Microbulbifer sp. 2205BS26-8]
MKRDDRNIYEIFYALEKYDRLPPKGHSFFAFTTRVLTPILFALALLFSKGESLSVSYAVFLLLTLIVIGVAWAIYHDLTGRL